MTASTAKPSATLAKADQRIGEMALAFPEVVEDAPWGHRAFKVRKKAFLFSSIEGDRLGISLKLPETGVMALNLPFTEPTGYGLGKSGWVSASFGPKDKVPLALIAEWLDESYRAIAPKKLLARIGAAPQAAVSKPVARKTRKAVARKRK